MTTQSELTCAICNCRPEHADEYTNDVTAAIEVGWIPDYWEGEDQMDGPVCPDCCQAYLRQSEDGEMEVQPMNRWDSK